MIDSIRTCVSDEFDLVDKLIVEQLHSDVDMVESIGQYIVDAGGKRLRPLLVLLSAAALGECNVTHIKFAAAVEFIHTATLLHDDVVDISSLRRGRPTANEKFGNAPSVLVGDFLYTRAFQLMVQLDNMALLRHMANTTNTIAEGEVLQLVYAGDPSISEGQYLDVITRKTAVLFAAACRGSALLNGADNETADQIASFGLNLGIAFQMIDDILDYQGDPAKTGKNVGDDLNEGKTTLPLLHVIRSGSAADAQLVTQALRNKSAIDIGLVIAAVHRSGGIDATYQRACAHRDEAIASLRTLNNSPALTALKNLAHLSVDREG